MFTIIENYCFIKLFAKINNDELLKSSVCKGEYKKELTTDFGPVGLEFDLYFRT